MRRWINLHCKTHQYSIFFFLVWPVYILGCWIPLPRSDPPKVNHCYCRSFVFGTSVWMMSVLATMLTRENIKMLIFHMANSIKVLASNNLLWLWNRSKWRWIILKKPSTMKLDGLGIVWNMKRHILVISKTDYVPVVNNFFP